MTPPQLQILLHGLLHRHLIVWHIARQVTAQEPHGKPVKAVCSVNAPTATPRMASRVALHTVPEQGLHAALKMRLWHTLLGQHVFYKAVQQQHSAVLIHSIPPTHVLLSHELPMPHASIRTTLMALQTSLVGKTDR